MLTFKYGIVLFHEISRMYFIHLPNRDDKSYNL